MAPLMIFLAHRDRLSRDDIHERLHTRLDKEAGCRNVHYRPSRLRRRTVSADVAPSVFLDQTYSVDEARLEIRFWKPASASYEYYWINWIEPARDLMFGWHQDDTHDEFGKCHAQLDYQDETLAREPAMFLDAHPLSVFEHRLTELPTALSTIQWKDETPTLRTWPPVEK